MNENIRCSGIHVRIAQDLGLNPKHVGNVIDLLDAACTVPFIARYRKECTGAMDELNVKAVADRFGALSALEKRKAVVLDAIEKAGCMSDRIKESVEACFDPNELEDIYLPYKPRRRTRAAIARERGLESLAKIVMSQRSASVSRSASAFVKGEVEDVDAALAGAKDIIAEWLNEDPRLRRMLRRSVYRSAVMKAKGDAHGSKYEDYEGYSKQVGRIQPHAFYALRRAENESVLKLTVTTDTEADVADVCRRVIRKDAEASSAQCISEAARDSYKRLMLPSIVTEVLNDLKERSDDASIALFTDNLRQVLLYPPVEPQPVLAIDPGFRSGCKVACLGKNGNLMAHDVIYPVGPVKNVAQAASKVKGLIEKYNCRLIALGDGTASVETERFLNDISLPDDVRIERVSEQGASIYSASDVARREFPDLDLTFRSAVSIGRRLQDPLAELVKIDPKSIGVGQYQHDVDQSKLKNALRFTVERCVNSVGVDLNTASRELLSYVAGIGDALASNIVSYRNEHGGFKSRAELKRVPRLGPKAFEQCSGFLRVRNACNPLDNSAVHPESYHIAERMAASLNVSVRDLLGNDQLIDRLNKADFVGSGAGVETISDIMDELRKPGRDPRSVEEGDWRSGAVSSIDDLKAGMRLKGKVVNITAFGAFVDLGIKQKGLIHISQLSDRRVASVGEVVRMWQIVDVSVLSVDCVRERISLSMKI